MVLLSGCYDACSEEYEITLWYPIVLYMFKIIIWYDKNDSPDDLGINFIKSNKVDGYELDEKR